MLISLSLNLPGGGRPITGPFPRAPHTPPHTHGVPSIALWFWEGGMVHARLAGGMLLLCCGEEHWQEEEEEEGEDRRT